MWWQTCWISLSTRTLFLRNLCLHLARVDSDGAAAITARSFRKESLYQVAELMIKVLKNADDNQEVLDEVCSQVKALTDAFPLYED